VLGFPTAHDLGYPSATSSSYPQLQQVPGSAKRHLTVRPGSLTQIPSTTGRDSSPGQSCKLFALSFIYHLVTFFFQCRQLHPNGLTQGQLYPSASLKSSPFVTLNALALDVLLLTHSFALKAVAIIAIQVQLLAPSLNKIARAFLSIGIILELLGILFAICFVQMRNHADDGHYSQPLSTLVHLALRVPTVLILTGVVGLRAALVAETLETSLGTAVAMSSFLIFGVVSCLLVLIRGVRKVDDGNDESTERI
jgi:hypothetical protein